MTKQELLELYNKSFYTNGGNGAIYFLSHRKQKILYDLVFSNKTQKDLANEYGVTGTRIGQIMARVEKSLSYYLEHKDKLLHMVKKHLSISCLCESIENKTHSVNLYIDKTASDQNIVNILKATFNLEHEDYTPISDDELCYELMKLEGYVKYLYGE